MESDLRRAGKIQDLYPDPLDAHGPLLLYYLNRLSMLQTGPLCLDALNTAVFLRSKTFLYITLAE